MRTAALCAVIVAAVWGVMHVGWYTHGQIVDTPVYQQYGDAMVHQHQVPYRDVRVEYPPAALPVFVVPALLERWDYRRVFQVLMAVCDAAAVFGVALIAGRRAAVAAALAPLALGSVVLSRFDFWPAALAVLALAALLRGRLVLSALLLGTAFAAKLWPALLAPFVVVWLVRTRDARAATAWLAGALATAAVWFIPFAVVSPAGVGHSFYAQLARPLQLESLGGQILIALHHVAGTHLRMATTFGSQNLFGPGTHAVALATTAAEIVALVAIWLAFVRDGADSNRLLASCAAAVAAAIAFGKVFSPQFLIWLIPLVPLVRRTLTLVLLAAALVLTQLYFPYHYWSLAFGFSPWQSWEVLARDLLVVALAAALVWPNVRPAAGPYRARLEALQRV